MKCKCGTEMTWIADNAGWNVYWCPTCGRAAEEEAPSLTELPTYHWYIPKVSQKEYEQ